MKYYVDEYDSSNSLYIYFVDLLEYSEDRSPWETVEEKLDEIRFVTGCFVAMVTITWRCWFHFCNYCFVLFLFAFDRNIMRKIIKRIPLLDEDKEK